MPNGCAPRPSQLAITGVKQSRLNRRGGAGEVFHIVCRYTVPPVTLLMSAGEKTTPFRVTALLRLGVPDRGRPPAVAVPVPVGRPHSRHLPQAEETRLGLRRVPETPRCPLLGAR